MFATHDINLLNEDFVRRDTIWFADKNEQAETELVRLSSLGLHKNISPYNAYRQGKLVKLPFTGAIYLEKALSLAKKSVELHDEGCENSYSQMYKLFEKLEQISSKSKK